MQGWINAQKDCRLAQILYKFILNMESIKLKCINCVKLKDANETSEIKAKLG